MLTPWWRHCGLQGEAIDEQVDKWVRYGTIEPSTGEYIKAVRANPGWCVAD
jgi:hypothetical protein